EGMAGRADKNGDGSVTDIELFRFLSDQLPAETSGKQHPWRSSAPAAEAVLSRGQRSGPTVAVAATTDSSATKQRKTLPAQLEPAPAGSPAIASSSTERIHGNDTQDKPAASRTPAARHGTAATPPTSETATVGQATGAQVDLTNKPISRA